MKKKILFMLSTLEIGGVEKSLISLLSFLPKEKYEITILLLKKEGEFLEFIPDYIKVKEVKWYSKIKPILMSSPHDNIKAYFKHKRFFKILMYIISYYLSKYTKNRLFYFKELIKDIPFEDEIYDYAIAYAGPTEIIDYFIIKRINSKNKIGWMHFDPTKININSKFYKYIYKRLNKIYAVSHETRLKLQEKFPENKNIKIFKNIIDERLIKNLSQEKIEDIDIEKDIIKIVTLGRLELEKGQDLAMRALKNLLRDNFKIHWYFIGDGPDRKYYEELIKELALENDVTFLGNKLNPYPYLAMSDIYVQPSRHEGYCIALNEAIILKKKIVTTDFSGALEQITDEKIGLICKVSEEDIYLKIKRLLKESEN